ncbi:radical SAM protein [Archangium sp.]|uniref:radical SAM protein n=1 Tax=Archangium sp. TaxID=1872627 RepID=UPI002D4B0F1D|nr:radical SAM protein [Archangium sp.]HYO56140.1 radical SAM protein [Archangium sp.]
MNPSRSLQDELPRGRILVIHPPYVHYSRLSTGAPFLRDPSPFLPVAPFYAGALLEDLGRGEVEYFDCQIHDLTRKTDFSSYDSIAIAVMGAQNVAPAFETFRYLRHFVEADRIYLGGQAAEGLSPAEFSALFPGTHQVTRAAIQAGPTVYSATIGRQLDKLSEDDLHIYLTSELPLPLSQGCIFGCNFCGAQTRQRERFFNTAGNLEDFAARARARGLRELFFYCTSLDFFQQALFGGDLSQLTHRLEQIIALSERYGVKFHLRALTRADSYVAAMKIDGLFDLVQAAGFHTFGFGADGAASTTLLRAMRRGSEGLGSDLLKSFAHAQEHGLVPEILYVFGIPEDTVETLDETKSLCIGLLKEFPSSIYRGFPAKNQIPGNRNWQKPAWLQSSTYQTLLSEPRLFANLGFEALANEISHPNPVLRKLTNHYAVEMSYAAHEMDRVLSYLTLPVSLADSPELMDEPTFELFRDIVARYAPEVASGLRLGDLPERRTLINELIPKDK